MEKIKVITKLKVMWNKKENSMEAVYENTSKENANYLFSNVFTDEFEKEMLNRGFDLKTLKFEIKGSLSLEYDVPSLHSEIELRKLGVKENDK